jgi:REP element-mobilizing transposase RayT
MPVEPLHHVVPNRERLLQSLHNLRQLEPVGGLDVKADRGPAKPQPVQRLRARGYFCAAAGSVTKEMVREYIANQFKREREGESNFKAEDDGFQP